MSGRKHEQESRSTEFRQRLLAWKETPESARLSLRALASELGTSHQLLAYYLTGLEKGKQMDCSQKANEESDVERRPVIHREKQRLRADIRPEVHAILLKTLENLKQEATRGPLHPTQFQMVKMFAKQRFPAAQELLLKCLRDGLKKKKPFAQIVKETPRQEGEACGAWVRRIWNECDKYDVNCPSVISEELLNKLSLGRANKSKNNLPATSLGSAKSFRTV